jgi:DNA-binding beta-propeller fold protein YncE
MTKTFQCPSCGAALENVDFTKPTTQCPFCGTVVTIPTAMREKTANPSSSAGPQVVINLGDYGQSPYLQTPIRPRSNPFGCIFGVLIMLIIVGVVGGGIFIATTSVSSISDVINAIGTPGGMATLTSGGDFSAIFATAAPDNSDVLMQFGGDGVGNGKFTDGRWLAIDGLGGIYVADYLSNGRVQAFDKEGSYLATFNAVARAKSIPIRCLGADRKGIVYVCRDGYIQKFNSESGDAVGTIKGTGNDYLDGMTFLPNGNLLVVTSSMDDNLLFFNPAGKLINRVEKVISTQTENSQTSIDIAVDGLGNIYLLSQRDNAVLKYSPDGKFMDRFGHNDPFAKEKTPGDFSGSVGAIAVDSEGRIYVTDFDGIKVFSNDGKFLELIPEPQGSGFIYDMAFNTKDELFMTDGKQVFQLSLNVGS